ncbi:hypothetical protein ABDJ34_08150 [Finegoldia dalianensis]|uniref:Uncharacterized protein n=1 Tax=Finegoldia dalianensis TaxID=3145239 RepID=A0ABW9KGJ3_9FIRM
MKLKENQNNFEYKTINLLDLAKCKPVKILHVTLKDIAVNVAREFCRSNKKFYYFFDCDKETCVIVALNNKNYIKILIDDSNNWTVSYKYTLFKNEIINASEDLNYLVSSLINDLILS